MTTKMTNSLVVVATMVVLLGLIFPAISTTAAQEVRATENVAAVEAVEQEEKVPIYQVTTAEKLALSEAESSLWRARYSMEVRDRALITLVTETQKRCEASGGSISLAPGAAVSTMQCMEGDKK